MKGPPNVARLKICPTTRPPPRIADSIHSSHEVRLPPTLQRVVRTGMLSLLLVGHAVSANAPDVPWPVRLRAQMARVSTVGYRLAAVTHGMCNPQMALTGLSIDYLAAYPSADRSAVAALLHMSDLPQVASVAPGSPADRAGVREGDDIAAIDGIPAATLAARSRDSGLLADEIEDRLAATPVGGTIALTVVRNGTPIEMTVDPGRGCAARFIVKTGKGLTAFSDPRNVAVGEGLVDFSRTDDELALVLGHELAHIVHRDAVNKTPGQRTKEDRADVLGAVLARCAGYDIETALAFWPRYNKQDWLRFFRDPTYRSVDSRIALIRANAMSGPCPPGIESTSDAGPLQKR